MQDETRIIKILGSGAAYIRDFAAYANNNAHLPQGSLTENVQTRLLYSSWELCRLLWKNVLIKKW